MLVKMPQSSAVPFPASSLHLDLLESSIKLKKKAFIRLYFRARHNVLLFKEAFSQTNNNKTIPG